MTTRAWGNEYRTTTVCVDSYKDGAISGRFYNPYLPSGKEFKNLMQFLLEIDQALDAMAFPQSFTTIRSFAPTPKAKTGPPGLECQKGELATFMVRIIFRQNSSWQGSIIWMEGEQEQSFRSALELIFLMDNALSQAIEKAS